jgi:riboflavin biosynthesis pyrimidine reductase
MNIMTLLVEGGAVTLTSFLKQRLVDRIIICTAPIIIGDGVNAVGDLGVKRLGKAIQLGKPVIEKLGPDMVISGYPIWR